MSKANVGQGKVRYTRDYRGEKKQVKKRERELPMRA